MIDLNTAIRDFAAQIYPPDKTQNNSYNQALQNAMKDVFGLVQRCFWMPQGDAGDNFWRSWSKFQVLRFSPTPPPLDVALHRDLLDRYGRDQLDDTDLISKSPDEKTQITLRLKARGGACLAKDALRLGAVILMLEDLELGQTKISELRVHRSFVGLPWDDRIQAQELDVGLSTYILGDNRDVLWRRDVKLEGANAYAGEANRGSMWLRRMYTNIYDGGSTEPQDKIAKYDHWVDDSGEIVEGDVISYGDMTELEARQWRVTYDEAQALLPELLIPLGPCMPLFQAMGR